jgi:hypothetical protein
MAEVIARVRREMQDRLKTIDSELASVESLIAEKARLERALATPPFAVDRPARKRGKRAAPESDRATHAPASAPVSLVRQAD